MRESELNRPNPDALLASLQREEAARHRGRLKVFLGMCPGVGKTYAMLEAGQRELRAGRRVVIGYVETHGRKETDALTQGLPLVPRRESTHRGVTFTEMDFDAVLAQRPELVLVDELAHTNAPDSRHPKRWQDVRELLGSGIDVFTTVNVQHVESRAEAVRQITGVEIRETVPDSVLDHAVLELVDLPPAELASTPARRPRLCAGARGGGGPELLPRGQPHRPPRTRAASRGRSRGRRHPALAAWGSARRHLEDQPPSARGRRSQSGVGVADPLDTADGRQPAVPLARRSCGKLALAVRRRAGATHAQPRHRPRTGR